MEWNMVVGGKYELAAVAAECEEWRTFEGREIPSGRAVLVHQILELPAGVSQPSLKDLAQRCTPGSGGVIETLSGESAEYVVTETGTAFRNLRKGLEDAATAPLPEPAEAGEDRFMRVGAWRVPTSFSAPPPSQPAEASVSGIFNSPSVAAEAPAPPAMEPGEFTRIFQANASAGTPPPPSASSEPGEFTRMFHAPTAGKPPAHPTPPVPPPPPAKNAPGEFTQFFQPSLGSTPFEEPRSPVPEPEPPAPSPGEYTRLFRSPAPPLTQAQSSGATGAFHTPRGQPPEPPPLADAGPSDFTRIIQSRPQPAAEARTPEAPKGSVPEPAPKRPGIPAVLVAVLAALAILAIGMILFFALRH